MPFINSINVLNMQMFCSLANRFILLLGFKIATIRLFVSIILMMNINLSLHANEAVFEWVKRVTGGGSELLVGISNDSQGNLYVIGHFGSTIKINPDGKTHGITS